MVLPVVMVLAKEPALIHEFLNFSGSENGSAEFSFYHYGFAIGISLSLIAQIGEQVDYLRFMPDKTNKNRFKWWSAVILAGPGWIILGFLKQIAGILLAALVLLSGASLVTAIEPIHMYNAAYLYVFENPDVALAVSFVFVVVSQIKINVTNAYAGSLAWSNFFSRLTHSHPGRVVWLIFNITIALLLIQLGVFQVLGNILGLYSNIAIAWIAAIVADLIINKPLGLSPPVIEFKRAYLFDINPVGTFSTLIASLLSIIAFSGFFGMELQAFSSIIALTTAFILSPLIAFVTKGKYYIARPIDHFDHSKTHLCGVCDNHYAAQDMATCPMYGLSICSLCCSLEGRCHDRCKEKKEFSLRDKLVEVVEPLVSGVLQIESVKRISSFLIVFLSIAFIVGLVLWTTFTVRAFNISPALIEAVADTYQNLFYILILFSLVSAWLIVLMHENREFVEDELVYKNTALAASETNLAYAQQVTHLGSWQLNLESNELTWSDEVYRIFEIDPNKFAGTYQTFINTIHPEDREMVKSVYQKSIENKTPYDVEHRLLMKDGRIKYVKEHGETYFDGNNSATESVGVVHDITEIKLAEEVIQHQAHFDSLTNLPNRFLALDRLAQLISEAKRHEKMVAVLFIDLDDFKKVNDTLGHETGDKVLIEAGKRLCEVVRKKDTVGRLGGDEFLILLGGLSKSSDALPVVEHLIEKLRNAFVIDGRELIVTASVGIATYPDDANNADTLLRYSDSAMYHAKDIGRNTHSFYTQAMDRQVSRRLAIEEQMHGALERNEFFIHYQPKFNIATNKIIGAEALLRWHNKELGDISPGEFISIAEQTGLILPIGKFVLSEALRKTKYWQTNYIQNFEIAVNLSPRQFRDSKLTDYIKNILEQHEVSCQYLELEITEGVLMSNYSYVEEYLRTLSELGIGLAMDDFGTGYSSLSYLRTYPFTVLKIDQSFIQDIADKQADRELVNAAIAMAHALNLKVVAEGVETVDQLTQLKKTNCDYVQGYLFSKPLPPEELEILLSKNISS